MAPNPILISGAGPTGLVLAIALLQNGVPVRIIDKLSSYRVGFKGSGIQPRSLELYNILGLLPEIYPLVGRMPQIKMYLPNGQERILEFAKLTENTPDRPYINPVVFGQDRHEAALRNHLERTYDCKVELDTELVSFEQNEHGVRARLSKKTDDGQVTEDVLETPYLVGCDGAHSVVRKQLGLPFVGDQKALGTFVGGDIRIKSPLDPNFWHVWGDRGSDKHWIALRAFETHDGRFNILCGGPEIDVEVTSGSREGLIKTFQEISGRTDIEFEDLFWLGNYTPSVRMVDQFSVGRVFIAGDSCHIHSPMGGQGLNTSIQDAFNLSWKLALTYKGLASAALLDTYSEERNPVVAAMLDKTTSYTNNKTVLRSDDFASVQRGFELRQFGINYRGSSILVDDFAVKNAAVDPYRSGEDGSVLAGDRAPDAPGLKGQTGTTSLFRLFGSTFHTVLVFGNSAPDLEKYAKDLIKVVIIAPQGADASGDVYLDTDGFAYKHYDVGRGVMYVAVRPDGVIGALTKSVDGVLDYFERLFT